MDIRIPKLGIGMAEGVLVKWLVDEGATVAAGQPIYLLETEKVENEIESPAGGIIRRIGAAGGNYPVGALVAVIE